MTTNDLINIVREILRDKSSPTRGGEFWSDDEIILALNAAQSVLVDIVIEKHLFQYFDRLIEMVSAAVPTDNPVALPQDYLYHISAVVKKDGSDFGYTASILTGGQADAYLWGRRDAAYVIGDEIYFLRDGIYSAGTLLYYRLPQKIQSGGANTDFSDDVYSNVIANKAAVILGLKELTNQRDFKKEIKLKQYVYATPLIDEFHSEITDVKTNKIEGTQL